MNEIMTFVLAFGVSFGAPAGGPDRWFAEDKTRHFLVSLAATNLTFGAARTLGLERGPAQVAAAATVAAAGIGKELHDRRRGDRFSARDLVWDAAGIGLGLFLASRAR